MTHNDLVPIGGTQPTWISIRRAVEAVVIPDGYASTLEMNEQVRVTQQLGDAFTVMTVRGQLFRIAGRDADALGREIPVSAKPIATDGKSIEELVWETLRQVYDPEIPVNVAELGLIYGCDVTTSEPGAAAVQVRMTLTAPGCGMSGILQQDVERRVREIPGVATVTVEITFDPPWTQERMSEAARVQLNMY